MITVVGSINCDLTVHVAAHPRPGETILGHDRRTYSGGKGANQAVAARLLGDHVVMVGAVGTDGEANFVLDALASRGVDTAAVARIPEESTGLALIAVDATGENTIIVCSGANAAMTPELVAGARGLIERADAVIMQGEIPAHTIDDVAAVVAAAKGRLILNLAPVVPVTRETLQVANPLIVNEHEAVDVLRMLGDEGAAGEAGDDPVELGRTLITRLLNLGVPSVVVTLGGAGAVCGAAGELASPDITHVPSPTVHVVDTTGAGDCFVGALAAALCAGRSLIDGVELAVKAGAYAVTGAGAQNSYPRSEADLTGLGA